MTKTIIVSSDDKGQLLAVKSDKKEPSFFSKHNIRTGWTLNNREDISCVSRK